MKVRSRHFSAISEANIDDKLSYIIILVTKQIGRLT